MRTTYVACLAALLLLAACGTETDGPDVGGDPTESKATATVELPTEVPAADGEVTTGGPVTVLDEGDGPVACVGGVLTSLPPQCGGPRLVGWDWSEHDGDYEDVGGTKIGDFVITGAFDGAAITPTEVVPAAEWKQPDGTGEHELLATPCPEPSGGWVPVDDATTTEETEQQAIRVARRLPDFAGIWVDQSINPASDDPSGLDAELAMNDPKLLVLNVAVTGDPAEAEAAIREVWGGALCVSKARSTDRELARIQDDTSGFPGILSSDRDVDGVNASVLYDDGSLQAWADQEYGEGVVRVSSALVPVAG